MRETKERERERESKERMKASVYVIYEVTADVTIWLNVEGGLLCRNTRNSMLHVYMCCPYSRATRLLCAGLQSRRRKRFCRD